MGKVTPFLMFNDQLEAAIAFYASTFPEQPPEGEGRCGRDDEHGEARRGRARERA